MKILIVSSDVIPHIGGKSTHVCDLIDGLQKAGHKTTLITRKDISRYQQLLIKLLISPLRLANRGLYLHVFITFLTYLIRNEINKSYKNENFDVVSVQDTIAANACKDIGKKAPVVLTMHTYFGIENTLDNSKIKADSSVGKLLLNNEVMSLENVNAVIAVDSRIKNHVIEVVDNKKITKLKEKVYSISNFTNIDNFYPVRHQEKMNLRKKYNFQPNDFIVICARRLVEKNGVMYAVKSMSYLKENPNIHLIVVGDGAQRSKIEEFLKANELINNVSLMGDISNREIKHLYSLSDVSLVPSVTVNGLQEATSISAIESMSCGIPVIASSIGGLCELIDDQNNGLLVKERRSDKIAEKIQLLRNDYTFLRGLSENAKNYIKENHSHINAAQKYEKIFLNAIFD